MHRFLETMLVVVFVLALLGIAGDLTTNLLPNPAPATQAQGAVDPAATARYAQLKCSEPGILDAGKVMIGRPFTLDECITFIVTGTLPSVVSATPPPPANTPAPAVNTPVPAQPTPVHPAAGSGWVHNPALPAPQGYPGWVRKAGEQQSNAIPREIELSFSAGQIFLMAGDHAKIPGLPGENVGGQFATGGEPDRGCYLLVGRGPVVWDTQPTSGENPPIWWYLRSGWDVHDADSTADPLVWAAEKAKDLRKAYPETCGGVGGIDLWIYNP